MEAIKGSDVNVPDAVFAWMLDGRGGVKPLENTDVIDEAQPSVIIAGFGRFGQIAGRLLLASGVHMVVLDHVIIGDGIYVSLHERGVI